MFITLKVSLFLSFTRCKMFIFHIYIIHYVNVHMKVITLYNYIHNRGNFHYKGNVVMDASFLMFGFRKVDMLRFLLGEMLK